MIENSSQIHLIGKDINRISADVPMVQLRLEEMSNKTQLKHKSHEALSVQFGGK